MEDNDGFITVTAANRTPKATETSPARNKSQSGKETKVQDVEMKEIENSTTRYSEKVRICMKYNSNYNPVKGEMTKQGFPRLRDLFILFFEADPSLKIKSTKHDHGLHRTAKFPGGNDAQTYFHSEEYPRKDGSGRTDFFVILESISGKTTQNLKQSLDLRDFLRERNIFVFAHRHESFRVTTIGHLFNKVPEATNLECLRDYLEKEMATARGISVGDNDMNKIELSLNRVLHFASDDSGKTFRGDTLAIQVVCASVHAKVTRELLLSGITGNTQVGHFVPRRQQSNNSSDYLKVLVKHEAFRRKHSVIRLKNLPGDLMDWKIKLPGNEDLATVSQHIWDITNDTGKALLSVDPAVFIQDDWLLVVANKDIESTKEKVQTIVDSLVSTEQYKTQFGDQPEHFPEVYYRHDGETYERQYMEEITKDLARDNINAEDVFQRVEPMTPTPVLKPSSYKPTDPATASPGVTWADMASAGNRHNAQPPVRTKHGSGIPGEPSHAFHTGAQLGFGRGGGTSNRTTNQFTTDFDMVSAFSDEDATFHTSAKSVEDRLAALQAANEEQNRVIAEQNARIEKMQQDHQRQLETIRKEQEERLEQMHREYQEKLDRISSKSDENTSELKVSMRQTMQECLAEQVLAIVAELGKAHIQTPNHVDINTQTTVSTTTIPKTTINDSSPSVLQTPQATPADNQGDPMEFANTTISNKRVMTHTPEVTPVKGSGSIVPSRKLPVPPSRKLIFATRSSPPQADTDDAALEDPPSMDQTPEPSDTGPPGQCL